MAKVASAFALGGLLLAACGPTQPVRIADVKPDVRTISVPKKLPLRIGVVLAPGGADISKIRPGDGADWRIDYAPYDFAGLIKRVAVATFAQVVQKAETPGEETISTYDAVLRLTVTDYSFRDWNAREPIPHLRFEASAELVAGDGAILWSSPAEAALGNLNMNGSAETAGWELSDPVGAVLERFARSAYAALKDADLKRAAAAPSDAAPWWRKKDAR